MSDAPTFISLLAGGRAWAKKEFLALLPGEGVVRTFRFSEEFLERVCLRWWGAGRCWWAFGTMEEFFGEGDEVLWKWHEGVGMPLELMSEDVVVIRY